jgi:hypothetical protein
MKEGIFDIAKRGQMGVYILKREDNGFKNGDEYENS